MVRSWMARGLVGLFATAVGLGCSHTHSNRCCPCQCAAPDKVAPIPAQVPEKIPAPTVTPASASKPDAAIPQLAPVTKPMRME
jgi:hypothetical protein